MALTRNKAKKIYDEKYINISDDKYVRLNNFISDNFKKDKDISKLNNMIDEVGNTVKFLPYVKYNLNELPLTSHRPRNGRKTRVFYVTDANNNKNHFIKFKNEILSDIRMTAMPIMIIIKAYKPIPNNMNKFDKVLAEMGLGSCINTPDVDNLFKVYTDMLTGELILDDKFIVDTRIQKFYSFKPRIEVEIYKQNYYVLKHNVNSVNKSKSYNVQLECNNIDKILYYKDRPKKREMLQRKTIKGSV